MPALFPEVSEFQNPAARQDTQGINCTFAWSNSLDEKYTGHHSGCRPRPR
jgi:hypothetical protein